MQVKQHLHEHIFYHNLASQLRLFLFDLFMCFSRFLCPVVFQSCVIMLLHSARLKIIKMKKLLSKIIRNKARPLRHMTKGLIFIHLTIKLCARGNG